MGKFYRFLFIVFCILILGSFSQPAQACWRLWDCSTLTTEEADEMAKILCKQDTSGLINSMKFSRVQETLASYASCSADWNGCNNNIHKLHSSATRNNNCKTWCEQAGNPNCQTMVPGIVQNLERLKIETTKCFIANVRAKATTANGLKQGFANILSRYIDFAGNGCWLCPVFKTVYDTSNTLATNTYNQLRSVFFSLLVICATALLFWKVFKFMVTLHGPNIGEFMTDLFKSLGLVMFLAIILKAPPSFITGIVVDIPASIGTGLANEMLQLGGIGKKGSFTYTSYSNPVSFAGCLAPTTQTLKICPDLTAAERNSYQGKALSAETYESMNCLLRKMSFELIVGMALGSTIIDYSLDQGLLGKLPHFGLLFVGILVFLCYFILYLMIPFKLIDLLIRLCFVVVLLPLFVVCYATPATRPYTKKGWEMFVSCFITLICLCLFMAFALQLIVTAFNSSSPTQLTTPL